MCDDMNPTNSYELNQEIRPYDKEKQKAPILEKSGIANALNCWQSLKLTCLVTGTKVETSGEMVYG